MTVCVSTWSDVFAEALGGELPCTVHGLTSMPLRLPVGDWLAPIGPSDAALLAHCVGPTLDVGCGPGRLSAHVLQQGGWSVGIDVVPAAIDHARSRGVLAMVRDVFAEDVPAAGWWSTALLADGNIGIGGDPVRLLRRLHQILAPYGRVVADLAPPGAGIAFKSLEIECGGRRSEPFPWALVGPEAVHLLAAQTGFLVRGIHQHGTRRFVVLVRDDR